MSVDASSLHDGGVGWGEVTCDAPGCSEASEGRPKLGEDWPPGWVQDRRNKLSTTGSVREAVFAYFGQLGGQTGGTFRATLEYLSESDDGRVIGVHHNSAERDGKRLDVGACLTFELKDGRVVDGRDHFFDLYAWDEFWS